MEMTLFQDLFGEIDAVTQTYVTDISSRAIQTITPFVSIGLTLTFIAFGLLIIRGGVQMPLMEFIGKSVRIGLIAGVALASGIYQGQIAEAIRTTPDALAGLLVPGGETGDQAAAVIDRAASEGFAKAGEAWEKTSTLDIGYSILIAAVGLIIIAATGVFVLIGGAFMILAKLGLAILAGLGPLFIAAMLWQPTQRFFEAWTGQVVNYMLMVVMLAASFGLMLNIYTNFVGGIEFGDKQNIAYNIGGVVILSGAMMIVLLQLPGVAAALGAGASISFLYELRALASGARAAGKAGAAAANMVGQAGGAAARAGAAVGGAAANAARSGGSAAASYFKGRKAA